MSNAQKSLVWKEYRETCPVGIAVALFAVLALVCQWGTGVLLLEEVSENSSLMVLLVCLALYVLTISAVSYAREIDEGRYALLRRFPITSVMLARAKVTWIGVSTLILAAVFALLYGVTLLARQAQITIDTPGILAVFTLSAVEFFVWGLFWSTRTRRQLAAVVLTPLFALALPMTLLALGGIAAGKVESLAGPAPITDFLADHYASTWGLMLRVVILALLAVPTWRGLLHWFDFQTEYDSTKAGDIDNAPLIAQIIRSGDATQYASDRAVHSPFRTIFTQTFRAPGLYVFPLSMFLVGVVLCWVLYDLFSQSKAAFQWTILLQIGFFVCFLATGIFARKSPDEDALLTRLGVTPGVFWFGRLAAGLVALAIPFALLLIFGSLERHVWPLVFEGQTGISGRISTITAWGIKFLSRFFLLLIPALWAGAFFRRRVFAILASFALAGLTLFGTFFLGTLFFWGSDFEALTPGQVAYTQWVVRAWWAVTLLPFLIASYYHVRLNLTGQANRRTLVREAILLLAPMLLFWFAAIPLLRIYSVPLLPETKSSPLRSLSKQGYQSAPSLHEALTRADTEQKLLGNAQTANQFTDAWNRFVKSNPDTAPGTPNVFAADFATSFEREALLYALLHARLSDFSPEELRQILTLLSDIPQTRPSLETQGERLAASLYAENRWNQNAGTRPLSCNPHSFRMSENKLYRRILLNKLEHFRAMTRYAEETLYRDTADYSTAAMAQLGGNVIDYSTSLFGYHFYRELPRTSYSLQLAWGHCAQISATPIYTAEVRRRMLLLETALLLYRHEQGDWPETLDALVAAEYLDALPTVPGTRGQVAFRMTPKGAEPEESDTIKDDKRAYFLDVRELELTPERGGNQDSLNRQADCDLWTNDFGPSGLEGYHITTRWGPPGACYYSLNGQVGYTADTPILWFPEIKRPDGGNLSAYFSAVGAGSVERGKWKVESGKLKIEN